MTKTCFHQPRRAQFRPQQPSGFQRRRPGHHGYCLDYPSPLFYASSCSYLGASTSTQSSSHLTSTVSWRRMKHPGVTSNARRRSTQRGIQPKFEVSGREVHLSLPASEVLLTLLYAQSSQTSVMAMPSESEYEFSWVLSGQLAGQ